MAQKRRPRGRNRRTNSRELRKQARLYGLGVLLALVGILNIWIWFGGEEESTIPDAVQSRDDTRRAREVTCPNCGHRAPFDAFKSMPGKPQFVICPNGCENVPVANLVKQLPKRE